MSFLFSPLLTVSLNCEPIELIFISWMVVTTFFMCEHVQATDEFYLNFISLRQLKFPVLRQLSEFCKIHF